MARSNRHDDNEEPDFFEEYDEAIKARVKSLKKIEDVFDAKALIALPRNFQRPSSRSTKISKRKRKKL